MAAGVLIVDQLRFYESVSGESSLIGILLLILKCQINLSRS